MAGECWNCGQWLSGGDLLEGYCWMCGYEIQVTDSGYPNHGETYHRTQNNE